MDTKSKNDFTLPFGIDFVVDQDLKGLGGFQTWKAAGNSFDITCPFCGGKRKMNVNLTKNVAKCNKCGCGSGYNTITLHAALTGLNNSESYKDLMNRYKGLESDVKVKYSAPKPIQSGITPAPIDVRDKVYRKLLSLLTLSEKHEKDLEKRGLSKEQIKAGLYKSVPAIGLHSLAYETLYASGYIRMFDDHKYWGIPGFTDIKDPSKVSIRGRKSGYFVPVLDRLGGISGMQIRYDNLPENASEQDKELYKKYSWFSSSECENGCSVTGCENIHFAGSWTNIPETINLTEGVLKADIASALSGKDFMGLVGVNNISQLDKKLFYLRSWGVRSVNIYVDMDYKDKKEVSAALLGIRKTINGAGKHRYYPNTGDCKIKEFSFGHRKVNGMRKGIKISVLIDIPKKLFLTLENTRIPEDKYFTEGNDIFIDYDYINCIRNCVHTLRIYNAEEGFENWQYLTKEERRALYEKTFFLDIDFEKTGLTYTEMNWNEGYKGIDDYYLYLRSINSNEIL